jgi:ankyrin repeat protein
MQLLIDNGSNIESRTNKGTSPLMIAALYGHLTALELLLKYGSNIEATALNGWVLFTFSLKINLIDK